MRDFAPSLRGAHLLAAKNPVAQKKKKRASEQGDATCPDASAKIFPFSPNPNHLITRPVSFLKRGALAIVTDVGNGMLGKNIPVLTKPKSPHNPPGLVP
jgi:hypothetical protein